MSITTEEQRKNSHIDSYVFSEMQKLVKNIDWDTHDGVTLMQAKGWEYSYQKGLIDKTPHYTRYEEDSIHFKNDKYRIQINMTSGSVVLQDIHNSESCYTYPTIFLGLVEFYAIRLIQEDLETLIESVVLSKSK